MQIAEQTAILCMPVNAQPVSQDTTLDRRRWSIFARVISRDIVGLASNTSRQQKRLCCHFDRTSLTPAKSAARLFARISLNAWYASDNGCDCPSPLHQ
jgi:hypothetical protein